jgi:two-component system OmpR family sensor kinase
MSQTLVAALLVIGVLCLTALTTVPELVSARDIVVVLSLAAVAVGVMCAVLAALLGLLIGDERAVWIGVALALYSVVAVPAAESEMTVDPNAAVLGNIRLSAHFCLVLLLLIAAFRPGLRTRCGGRNALFSALLLCVVCGGLGLVFPAVSLAITSAEAVRAVIALGAVTAGAALAVLGWKHYSPAHSWIGLGCAVIGLAHLARITHSGQHTSSELSFVVLRLLGLALVLVGLRELSSWALRAIDGSDIDQDELRLELRRSAEQRHELRNGLAGLAGAADLLESGDDDGGALRAAVAAEVARLEVLLRLPGARIGQLRGEASPCGEYPVEQILRQQVVLRRSAGMDVHLDIESGLRAVGTPHTLAQVLANVLANCVAHAPGSPVRIHAGRRGGAVVLRVTDFGPGVIDASQTTVFEAGERRPGSSGQGLGLHISKRLLRAEGGSIEIRSEPNAPGCTVLIHLPVAAAAAPAFPITANRRQQADRASPAGNAVMSPIVTSPARVP